MGEGIIEATITRWFIREGDRIEKDQPLLEVATDKVDTEVPSPASGVLTRIIYHDGEIPKVGEVLAVIDNGEEEPEKDETSLDKALTEAPSPKSPPEKKAKRKKLQPPGTASENDREITPFIRFLARDRGITTDELKQIEGTGMKGRITRNDLNDYLRSGRKVYQQSGADRPVQPAVTGSGTISAEEAPVPRPGEEVIPMSRTRQLIAEHMVRSKRTSPHVTSMVEIDVTGLVQWREANKEAFLEKFGIKLTYTPVIIEASVKALKLFPDVNISVSGNYIIRKGYINIGVATALPDGNLIVPVIKDADKRNFTNLAKSLSDLAERARKGKLEPSEIKGGTFTITNMGQYENVSGTPIINQPEAAILAVGAIKKKPAVVNLNGQECIGIRDIMILSLTYDHRVIDGALGGSFVKAIGENIKVDFPLF